MADILIRGLSAEAVARIDDEAATQRLSRNEYLRRRFEQSVQTGGASAVTVSDLRRATAAARDLLDEAVVRDAWR